MIREIRITAAANGFIVNVGCQTLVFTGSNAKACVNDMLTEMESYLADPESAEAFWLQEKCFNLKHTMPEPQRWRPEGNEAEAMCPPQEVGQQCCQAAQART